MCDILKPFLESQLFGIIIGAILTAGFTLFVEWRKSVREQKVHLREKREKLYEQMYEFVMRYEKDARTYKSRKYISGETRDAFNAIEPKTIWAAVNIRNLFYSLFGEIMDSANGYKKHWEKTLDKNRKKILDFKEQIRKELGLKD